MGCSICLGPYTADNRPAALPCGHIFHYECVHEWLRTRTHGVLPTGCPLCKAPASTASIIPLWPDDDADFLQYAAVHSDNASGPHSGLLASVREWVSNMHAYAMAAHGLRSSAMSRASKNMAHDIIREQDSHASMKRAMDALADAVLHAERLSRELADKTNAADERALALHAEQVQLKEKEQGIQISQERVEKDRTILRQKQKVVAQRTEELAEKERLLERRGKAMAQEHQAHAMRIQEGLAAAKSQSAEAIRKAALAEESSLAKCAEAEHRIKAAEDRVADMAEALADIRKKNQSMADQMRELQAALASSKAKRRAERAEIHELRKQLNEPLAPLIQRDDNIPLERSSSPTIDKPSTPTSSLLYDMDDTQFPMPGGAWPTPAPKPMKRHATDTWERQLSGTLVFGPKRRPK